MDQRAQCNILSLCSGGAGLELGLQLALGTTRVICWVEWEAFAFEVLAKLMEAKFMAQAPMWSDIRTFDGKPWRGVVDCITAGYPCFAAGTLILTYNGYRPIESLVIGDRVLTCTGKWQKVNAIMSKDGASLRKVVAQGSGEIITTDDHPFYAREYFYKYASKTKRKEFTKPEWLPAKCLEKSKYFIGQILPSEQPDRHSTEFWWLVGRYLADGWRKHRKTRGKGIRKTKKPAGRVIICCSKKEKYELAARIKEAGYSAYCTEERTVYKFHITKKYFYEFLEPFGHGAGQKLLPGFAFELESAKAKSLLDGYFSGDGSTDIQGNKDCTTVSRTLAYSIALLAQRAYGIVASITKIEVDKTTTIEGRVVNQRTQFKVRIPHRNRSAMVDENIGWKLVRKNEQFGSGRVYNISVENDESYIANGAIVHNCQPFSVGGKRRGSDDNRYLWPHVHRIIGEIEPAFVFFENVQGHVALGFEEVARDLEQLGYSISAGLFTAEEVGTPQKRERLYILGIKKDQPTTSIDSRINQRRKTAKCDGVSSQECPRLSDISNAKSDDGNECKIPTDSRDSTTGGEISLLSKTLESGGIYSNVPLWPFRPNQHDEWKQFIVQKPDFAPFECDVRELVDGVARDRILWIKMLGNGVVPLQSAYAFCTLWASQRCHKVK